MDTKEGTETSTEKYTKVLQWLLNNVNPELQELINTLQRYRLMLCLPEVDIQFKYAEGLPEVLDRFEEVETILAEITQNLVPAFNPRSIIKIEPSATDEGFPRLFARYLPRIDEALSAMEASLKTINTNITNIELEETPPPPANQTPMQRQVRFVDKAKRIRKNLTVLEEALLQVIQEPEPQPQIELLYTPPAWSVPPTTSYYFEVREGDTIIKQIKSLHSGHLLIGRLPICDIVVDDPTCSRQHAVIQFRPGDPDPQTGFRTDEVYIYDLGSTSGSYVNGMPLQPKAYYPLYRGDVLQFGQYSSAFILKESPPDASNKEPAAASPAPSSSSTTTTTPAASATPAAPSDSSNGSSSSSSSSSSSKDPDAAPSKDDPEGGLAASATVGSVVMNAEPRSTIVTKPLLAKEETSAVIDSGVSSSTSSSSSSSSSSSGGAGGDSGADSSIYSQVLPEPRKFNDPKDPSFDREEYKKAMIDAYERQQRENAEILRRMKERIERGLPPDNFVPEVKTPPVSNSSKKEPAKTDKKKKKKFFIF